MSKQDFIDCYTQNIQRRNADKFLEWLERTDFFVSPASTKFHLAVEGGLCEHSLNVFHRLKRIVAFEYPEECPFSDETLAICGLLHDICKTNSYRVEMRNVKVDGKWEQQPYYTVDEQFPYGHGEKSVFIIERYLRLSLEEAVAIRYHMGGFDSKPGDFSISKAFEQYPLAVLLHSADFQTTYLDEKRLGQ